ncbi:MAG TPA: alanine racemase [Candidatus Binataceae bacterium]|jgi:alanine racemase
MMVAAERPTVAEIDLAALVSNYRALIHHLETAVPRGGSSGGETRAAPAVMAVVKADAYGHGAPEIARTLAREGCNHFGVATVAEGRELRRAGITGRVYIMGGFFADQAAEIVTLDLTPFIIDSDRIRPLDDAAIACGRNQFPVHLKVDTGASRLGVTLEALDAAIAEFRRCPSLQLEGIATLLASAGDPSSGVTSDQLSRFERARAQLKAAGFDPPIAHAANSAAAVLREDANFNMVRLGLSLYGLPPVPSVRELVDLKPVMTFKTRLMQTKRIAPGAGVSYGHTYLARRETNVGVLPVGYADGYRRGLQHGGEVIIRGRRAAVIGAVCMDLTMIDVTDVPGASVGDEAILWGGAGEAMISVNDVARLANTISYEMLCTVGRRVPRTYIG